MYNIPHTNKNFNHLSISERKLIQSLAIKKYSISEIARLLGRNKSTISRQLANKRNLDFIRINHKVVKVYSALKAQDNYSKNKSNCGAKYKLFKDPALIKYIENCVINLKWSPDTAISRANHLGLNFKIHISAKSIYNYIDRQQIKITPFDLRFRLRRNKAKKRQIREHKRKLGKSIELRPSYIKDRSRFGDWEGDCVVDKHSNAIFVLQERMSRVCIIQKLESHTSEEVLKKMLGLKSKFGENFKKIFKSITLDNGSEFYKMPELVKQGIEIYYTHPYCSYEKGSVENLNGIIRRYIPKGKNLETITRQKIKAIEEQINTTPRKILQYKTPEEYFNEELERCMLAN